MDDQSVKKKALSTAQWSQQQHETEIALVPIHPVPNRRPRLAGGGAEVVPLAMVRARQNAASLRQALKKPVDEHIGLHLKAVYDDVLNQPIPDRFLDLLAQLEKTPAKDKDTG